MAWIPNISELSTPFALCVLIVWAQNPEWPRRSILLGALALLAWNLFDVALQLWIEPWINRHVFDPVLDAMPEWATLLMLSAIAISFAVTMWFGMRKRKSDQTK